MLVEMGLQVGDYFIVEGIGSRTVVLTPRTAKEEERRRRESVT
jgi:hypothetical protein